MAIQSSFYATDGTTRTFPSTKHIATKQHCSTYRKLVVDSTWVIVPVSEYELVNNSIVFIDAPSIVIYSMVEVRVADSQDELSTNPSDIAIVASSITNVNTVATNISSVNTTATNIGAVNTVSGSIANVNTTSANIVNVNIVAGNTANINATVMNEANINIVALDLAEPISEINTVATSIANVDIVGNNISSVNTNATNISNINSVATTIVPNIVEILLADDNAVIATAQATIATTKAAEAAASAASLIIDAVPTDLSTNAVSSNGVFDALFTKSNLTTSVQKDSDTGAAAMPYGTTAQRPGTPAVGYMRFNTDLGKAEVWNGSLWSGVGGGATGGGADTVFVETSFAITQNYTLTAGKSAMTVGDASGNVTIANGVTVTIPDGSKWEIL